MLTIFQVSNGKRTKGAWLRKYFLFQSKLIVFLTFSSFELTLAWEGLEFKAILKVLLDCPNLQLNFF